MAGNEPPSSPDAISKAEDKLLRRLRYISGGVILVCIVFLVLIDPLGRLFISPEFHVSEVIVGTLMGALLVILGIEGLNRLPKVPR